LLFREELIGILATRQPRLPLFSCLGVGRRDWPGQVYTRTLKNRTASGQRKGRGPRCSKLRARPPKPTVNCAPLPDTLLESELFGFEPGAFTDARRRKEGLLERAHGGTLFLDEIATMSASVQAKLLRVLEESTFMRLGGTRPIKINVRLIARRMPI